MKSIDAARALAIGAGVVIIGLTATAFWLSYAHLAEVALAHGLGKATERAWAWPACLDLFIIAGEIMWLRAALAHNVDPWAIALTVIGSAGSIALNVAGVTGNRDPSAVPLLDYVVAAVPPTAALLAFGALMRQVHQVLAGHVEQPAANAEVTIERADDDQPLAPNEAPPMALKAVTTPVIELPAATPMWDAYGTSKVTNSVPAETTRQVVTEQIVLTPRELLRKARKLHWMAVTTGGRGMTIDMLRREFGLSRREATDLRRKILEDRS
ncbi:DUF2637 domain-containing protein [Streptomyces sp. H27-C3]|uniref:DUF2637 domain-containing protein n=1 Tax=Streptomyces sp. H27-C3 TaxID=3046305 RepID=UPI0024BB02C0|nr:DUF2637 domain-containing protein [Streptomyces sp. H27-C3]MDJ0461575.1 DUF2637 domain-containing protein [Streptomyces sp. H27-C3]